ncbi:MAG: hypothetical protein HQ509_05870 [Candidatus Marinimicrobia bacterium]|nr:hypothetical protein [Candidatus Neomarinimicrobiota bacterium]
MKKLSTLVLLSIFVSAGYNQALPTAYTVDDLKVLVENASRNDYKVIVEEFTGFL